jgi:hypothetical protein
MKRLPVTVSLFATTALVTTALFSACEPTNPQRPKPKPAPSGFHTPPPSEGTSAEAPDPADEKKPEKTPATTNEPVVKDPVPEQPKVVGEVPYGKNVPGKPGFVTSPYSPYQGYIDVRGFPPGTEVKDPYSGKTFLVP